MSDPEHPDDPGHAAPAPGHVDMAADADSEAEYTLEYRANCPKCGASLKTLKVVRLLRTKVNFVSTLPRRGRVMICPSCRSILSGELTLV